MNLLSDLIQLNKSLPAPQTLENLAQHLVYFAVDKFEAASGCLALLSGDILTFPACLDAQRKPVPPPDEDTTWFILNRVVLPARTAAPHLLDNGAQNRAVACIPLINPSGVLGALYLEYPTASQQYIEKNRELMEYFGCFAATRIAFQDYSMRAESEYNARQRAEDQMRTWKSVIQAWPGSVLITDKDGRVTYCNPHFSAVSGYAPDEILRRSLSILKSDVTPEETFANMWSTINSGQTWKGEFCNRRKDGSLYWVSAIVGPIPDERGAIAQFYSLQEDIDREKAMQLDLQRLAITDPLTGVLNRGQLFFTGDQEIREAARYTHPLTLLIADIDHMRQINERFGHMAGDQVLKAVAELLNHSLRDVDVLGRLSGEEFAVLMPYTPLPDAIQVANRLRQQVADLVVYTASGSVRFTISTGVAQMAPGLNFSQLLEQAEKSLKDAKKAGPPR